jgi:hypothetical protein
MGLEQTAFKLLSRLRFEDMMVLFLFVFFTIENRCDRYFKIILLIIFLSDLEQGLLGK